MDPMHPELAARRLAEAKRLLAQFDQETNAFINDETRPMPDYPQWAARLANRLQDLVAILEQEQS